MAEPIQSPLYSKLVSVQQPRLPRAMPSEDLYAYELRVEQFHREMLEYIRKLVTKFTAQNLVEELRADPNSGYPPQEP